MELKIKMHIKKPLQMKFQIFTILLFYITSFYAIKTNKNLQFTRNNALRPMCLIIDIQYFGLF